jgi:hypothetical protein
MLKFVSRWLERPQRSCCFQKIHQSDGASDVSRDSAFATAVAKTPVNRSSRSSVTELSVEALCRIVNDRSG